MVALQFGTARHDIGIVGGVLFRDLGHIEGTPAIMCAASKFEAEIGAEA